MVKKCRVISEQKRREELLVVSVQFLGRKDPLKLVIVRDRWLTGLDMPCCHTMHVDKPMAGGNLMQL